jgi:hypothetical protein
VSIQREDAPTYSFSQRRARLAAAFAVLAMAGGLWFSCAKEARPSAVARAVSVRPVDSGSTAAPPELAAIESGVAFPSAEKPATSELVIDAAYVEKTEVCRGEENFAVVEASTLDGSDDFVSITVTDPETGQLVRGGRVPFRLREATTEPLKVTVQGLHSAEEVTLPDVTVKDCDEPVQVTLAVTRTLNAPDRVSFEAKIEEAGGARVGSFQAYEYEWVFGDGQTARTATGRIEHSYEGREQKARQSSFVASVSVRERGGRTAVGSAALTFSNFGFLKLRFEDEVELQVGADAQGDGAEPERLWLYHGYGQPVRLSQVVMREVQLSADDGAPREVARATYSPAQALGFSEIAARQSRTVAGLMKLAPTEAGVLRYFDVEGQSADGKPARTTFTLAARSNPG